MAEHDRVLANTHRLRRRDVFHLALRQNLRAHEAAGRHPAQHAEHDHNQVHALRRIELRADDGGEDHRERDERQAADDLRDTHDEDINPAAEVTGDAAEDDAQNRRDDDGNRADGHRHLTAVDDTGQHVAAEAVRAEHKALEPPRVHRAVAGQRIVLVAGNEDFFDVVRALRLGRQAVADLLL